jgi:2-amino-4-hydroxy-6-hydroxymethyldihydropteridine diphosphokinase
MSEVSTVTLALGSNLGDRLATLQRAVDGLAAEGVRPFVSSRVWESDPVGGPPGQPSYLNAVIRATTTLMPEDILVAVHRVEDDLGRTRDVRWGARTIDVDVLLVDDLMRDDPDLTIPHPRLADRAFVVLPLLEIDPDPVVPGVGRLLERSVEGAARPVAPPLRL